MSNPDRDAVDREPVPELGAASDGPPSQPVKRKPIIRNEARAAHDCTV